MSITHAKVSAVSDGGNADLVQPSDWNDDHTIDLSDYAGALTAGTATVTLASTDTISEKTAAAGVTIDGVLLKDNDIEVEVIKARGPGGSIQTDVWAPLTAAGESGLSHHLELYRASDDATPPRMRFTKARGSFGANAIVNAGDAIGEIVFSYDDGATTIQTGQECAAIMALAGTPGAEDAPGSLGFYTRPAGGTDPLPRWSITKDGDLEPNTDSTYDIGSSSKLMQVVYTDAVNFGAESLSVYDEGEWTPALGFVNAGDESWTYTTQLGRYQRVGNTVRCSFYIVVSAMSFSTATGGLQVKALPFTSAAGYNFARGGGGAIMSYYSAQFESVFVGPYGASTNALLLYGGATALNTVTHGNIVNGETPTIAGFVIYEI